jgi:hypothetical protein
MIPRQRHDIGNIRRNEMQLSAPDVAPRPVFPIRGPFVSDGGYAWIARLPFEFQDDADGRGQPQRSCWRLLEDGIALGPPHSPHADLRQSGGGRHSHWAVQLYFSTSDNSDPNANGRHYALRWDGEGDKPWLLPLLGAAAAEPVPFGPRPEVQACSGLIVIYGASFCGSTLVNSLLGSHPLIYGGGELHWLIEDRRDSLCAICRGSCRFWTQEARAAIRIGEIYHQVARMFGRPYVVDISKMREWYSRVLPHFPGIDVVRVLMTKHPLRHTSSFVEKAAEFPEYGDPIVNLHRLRTFYEGFSLPGEEDGRSPRNERTAVDIVLRYEDFVASPAKSLTPILARIGLQYDPRMDNWASTPHHHIGGNIGPRVQISNDAPVLPVASRKYRQRGIFLDNSFGEILDIDTIEAVLRDDNARWISERFAYGGRGGGH